MTKSAVGIAWILMLAIPACGWGQNQIGIALPHAGDLIPLFEFVDGSWRGIDLRKAAEPSMEDEGPIQWYSPVGFHGYTPVESRAERTEDGRMVYRIAPTPWPTQHRVIVFSDTLSTAYALDRGMGGNLARAGEVVLAIESVLGDLETGWIEQNPAEAQGSAIPRDVVRRRSRPVLIEEFRVLSDGWHYLFASRSYPYGGDHVDPGCWTDVSVSAWVKSSGDGHAYVPEDHVELSVTDCDRKSGVYLSLLGAIRTGGRAFVVGEVQEWDTSTPVVLELTNEGPVIRAMARGVDLP
ncbi:MAG: hypothetical protein OEZ65_09875 [Gemmatimonadota bacterium]|nr:hypothetical protein [Gemmatimonadota bacterium]